MSTARNLDELREKLTTFSIHLTFFAGFPIMLYKAWEALTSGYTLSTWSSILVYVTIGLFGIFRKKLDYRIRASVSISLIFLTSFFSIAQWGVLNAALLASLASSILAIILLGRKTGIQLALLTCGAGMTSAFVLSGTVTEEGLDTIAKLELLENWWPQILAILAFYISLAVTISMIENTLKRTITQLEEQKSELEKLNQELTVAKTKAEQASESKSQFLGIMSHELRTPLNPVLGFTNLLKEEEQTDDSLEYISQIETSANHLLTLIDSMLKYVEFDSKNVSTENIQFSINELCETVIDSHQTEAQEKGLELEYKSDFNSGVIETKCDPTNMKTLLSIFLSNAIRFTKKGKIELSVKRVDDSNDIEFLINDTGIGISKEAIERIFEPFYQEQPANTRSHEGIGLGLSFAHKMIELKKGKISVQSTPGEGSQFMITIPNVLIEKT